MEGKQKKAFPFYNKDYKEPFDMLMYNEGMSLLDYFAGQVLTSYTHDNTINNIANYCYSVAEEMLKVREEKIKAAMQSSDMS